MATVPDHLDISESEHALAYLRLRPTEGVEQALQAIKQLIEQNDYAEGGFTAADVWPDKAHYQLDVTADRTGVVGPLLDEVCAALREHPALDARIKIPGWLRTFYGWELHVWEEDGK